MNEKCIYQFMEISLRDEGRAVTAPALLALAVDALPLIHLLSANACVSKYSPPFTCG